MPFLNCWIRKQLIRNAEVERHKLGIALTPELNYRDEGYGGK
jgi:hypothetical protein